MHGLAREFAVTRSRGRGYDPGSARRRADRAEVWSLVASGDNTDDAGLGCCQQCDVVRCRDPQHRTANRVIDDINAVRDRGVDCAGKIRRVAAGALITRTQPACLVHRDTRARRHALDAAYPRTENGRIHAVAGGRCGRVRAVTVNVACR